ncbi:MAG: IS4 family transposase [Actinobacteria bacterium]|nr:IS4 family transposase [Actinomycetota bacterium]
MSDLNPGGSPAQFRCLFRSLVLDPGLLFHHVLSAEALARVVAEEMGKTADRIFTPMVTLCTFLSQILSDDHGCRAAVARLMAWRCAEGLPPCSPDTGGYCKARQRLTETLLHRLVRDTADGLQEGAPEAWLFHGRKVTLVDGSTVSMPDTPENQAEYPQHGNQEPGCGFPIARVVVLIALATGAVLDAAVGPRKGKLSGESTLLRGLHVRLTRGDILLGDRCFCSYFEVALLTGQGVDVVMRQNEGRPVDFRSGRRLGHDDHLVVWHKPQRASWMDPETYAAIPETVTIRELRVRVKQRGFRTRVLIVMTTLLGAQEFSHDELATLYRARWHAELDIRSLKQALKMDVLRCRTPGMVRKEIWAHLLVANLIRGVMAEAAREHGVLPRELSFQGARQTIEGFRGELSHARPAATEELRGVALKAIASHRVGDRPDRVEPRVRKRRPKNYPLMHKPRPKPRRRLTKAA